ncbi:SRPBCC family protein [Botrimarina hoheduenensis]|uniref:Activator of Hsp90 ATPase homologue 1/2-like C-terminal domain-containing protein n=1 Tax=Botrimarina hoheduenensis TaxID=2528000 RepID=A0A5C5WAR1_9BACT|nr:SRPBCC family protein [Botrimarina hoheduenensis]TWT46692.1 hypothetical protein Pla111_17930 [Botrimarina hoheduenensis]
MVASNAGDASQPTGYALRFERSLAAPRALVWAAWTEPERLAAWCCPTGCDMLFAEGDLQPGGAWRSGMRTLAGREYIACGEYREIAPTERLVFTHRWERADGLSPETIVTVTLSDESEGCTRLVLEQCALPDERNRNDHHSGWSEAIDNLAAHLDTVQSDIVLCRVFDAPRELVWQAWTESEHIAGWFGPACFTTRVVENDFRPGGAYRYVMIGPDGTEYPFGGSFLEIRPHECVVATDEFDEGFSLDNVELLPRGMVTTTLFEDVGGRTRVTIRIAHPTIEDRDRHDDMGVIGGWRSSFHCLDELLSEVQEQNRSIEVERVIAAPRELAYDAFLDTTNITHWWGPEGFTTTTRAVQTRPDGRWRFTMHGPDGRDYENLVIYRELSRPERLCYDHPGGEEFENVSMNTTVTFTEVEPDKTRVTMQMTFATAAERDRVEQAYGAIEGAHHTLARLAQRLETSPSPTT